VNLVTLSIFGRHMLVKRLLICSICCGVVLAVGMSASAKVTDSIRFATLDGFFNQIVLPDRNAGLTEPAEAAAMILAQFYGMSEPPPDDFSALANPLQIPDPLNLDAGRGEALLERTSERLRQFGLGFNIYYPASFPEAEQIAARGIARGDPVVTVHPHPMVVFGYDYRDTDPLWYVLQFAPWGEMEFINRSAWRANWWLWEENPVSMILLEITGPDTTKKSLPSPKATLENLLTKARTDSTTGVTSYMRPIIYLIDSLKNANVPPEMIGRPENPADPLNLLRAANQRSRLRDFLESLMPLAKDSTVEQGLRLAVYSAGKAADEFLAAANELYGPPAQSAAADSVSAREMVDRRWVEHHLEAAERLTEVLRWERQMLGVFQEITAIKKPFH